MPYRLKENTEAFQVVDGAFAGRRYEHGKIYADADIPPQERQKFEIVDEKNQGQSPEKKEGGSRKGDEIPLENKGGKK